MSLLNTYKTIKKISESKTVIALGLFDGVHRGHRKVISTAVRISNEMEATPAVFTFLTDKDCPDKKAGQGMISTISIKAEQYERLGVEAVFMPEFSDIKGYDAKSFVKDILVNKLNAVHIVCGYDFRFGVGAKADGSILRQIAQEYGCGVTVVPQEKTDDGKPISSTAIRKFLNSGDIKSANELLGYNYSIDFVVKTGRRLGSRLGFPTINQEYPKNALIPHFGVYATVANVYGKNYPAVTDVGVKPTVGGVKNPLAETYIIGVNDNFYGKKVKVSFIEFLRDEKKFNSIEELKRQIEANAKQAENIFEKINLDYLIV